MVQNKLSFMLKSLLTPGRIIYICFLSVMIACNTASDPKVATQQDSAVVYTPRDTIRTTSELPAYLKPDGDSLLVDPFEIDLQLSDKAVAKLKENGETIILSISLEGTPKDEKDADSEKFGTLLLGQLEKEIVYGEPIRFDRLKLSRKKFDQLENRDFDFNMNVFTGRRTSQNNLLAVDALLDPISKVVNKKHVLKGKLIYGDDE